MPRHFLNLIRSCTATGVFAGLCFAQPAKMELRVVKVGPAPEPVKQPGDAVSVDPDGTINVSSNGRSMKIVPKAITMRPLLEVAFAVKGDSVEYTYTVANGSGATHDISAMGLSVADSQEVRLASAPEGWRSMPVPSPFGASLLLMPVLADDDPRRRIRAGGKVTLSLLSRCLPGLVKATIHPTADEIKPGVLTEGEFQDGISEWARQALLKAPRVDNPVVLTIGPKVLRAQDKLANVHSELREAAESAAVLLAHRAALLEAARLPDAQAIAAKLSSLEGGTPFEKAFLAAMSWRLKSLLGVRIVD
jgi:hypothetical protein